MASELVERIHFMDMAGNTRPIGDVTLADIMFQIMHNHGQTMLEMAKLREEIAKLRSDLTVTFRDEFHPDRKAMSDELAEKVFARLAAESKVRRRTLGGE